MGVGVRGSRADAAPGVCRFGAAAQLHSHCIVGSYPDGIYTSEAVLGIILVVDGPTAIFNTINAVGSHLLGPIAIAAYSIWHWFPGYRADIGRLALKLRRN